MSVFSVKNFSSVLTYLVFMQQYACEKSTFFLRYASYWSLLFYILLKFHLLTISFTSIIYPDKSVGIIYHSMVQLIYYESRGISCSYLLRNGMKKVVVKLEACENWPYPSSESQWLLTFNRFLRNWCKVVQITSGGTKRYETIGHATFTKLEGTMFVTGKFKTDLAGKQQKLPDFCLYLTTNIMDTDFYRGCLLTGMLERGNRKLGIWESTHYAYVKREGY